MSLIPVILLSTALNAEPAEIKPCKCCIDTYAMSSEVKKKKKKGKKVSEKGKKKKKSFFSKVFGAK